VTGAREEIYDDIGLHLAEARSFDRAAVPLGMYLAWCANHQLLSTAFRERAAGLVMRVQFRDITGSELLVAGCGGVLAAEHLSSEGRAFTEHYYPGYLREFCMVFGPDPYAVRDDWDHYDRIAPKLTRALMSFRGHAGSATGAAAHAAVDGAAGASRPRWKFWNSSRGDR
jgi:hypothetical protein